MFTTGSVDENTKRLDYLYRNHHSWLIGAAYNMCKNEVVAEDLVGDLYVYLAQEVRAKIWYKESFNLIYCMNFLSSRFINKVKRDKKINYKESIVDDRHDEEYDYEWDEKLAVSYDEIVKEIYNLQKTKMFSSAMLFRLYWLDNPDETLEGLSKKIGISNSTAFLNIKKVKNYLKDNFDNPFI